MSPPEMPPAPPSSPAPPVAPLRISAEDAVEIFVLDGNLQVAARGIGAVAADLPEGIYKIKLRAGLDAREELLVHRAPLTEKAFPALSFSSPAPLAVTDEHDAEHADAARRESRRVHVGVGAGSSIFLFAREWRSAPAAPGAVAPADPVAGVRLERADGRPLVDVATKAARGTGAAGAWAACTVDVEPGLFLLVTPRPDGELHVQSIAAARGWQTQVFLLRRTDASAGGSGAAAASGAPAIFMARDRGFDPDRRDDRLSELIRQALVARRPVLSSGLRGRLEHGVDQPMLGILAGHLLLQEPTPDRELLAAVVRSLRAVLPDPHPDVEALALAAGPGTAFRFAHPPMLRASWDAIVRATATQPALVPSGSPAAEVFFRLTDREPWLVWRRGVSDEEQADLADAFVDALKQLVDRRGGLASVAGSLAESLAERARRELATGPADFLRKIAGAVESTREAASAPPPGPRRRPSALVPDRVMELLVSRLGIPRSSVESMIDGGIQRLKRLGED